MRVTTIAAMQLTMLELQCPERMSRTEGQGKFSGSSPVISGFSSPRTFPGVNRLIPEENGANLISTFKRAFELNGAEGGVGLGP